MKTANTHWAGQQKIKIRFSTYKYRFRVESLFICFVLFCFVFDLLPSAFLAFFAAVDDRCCLHGRVSRWGVCGRDQDIAGGPPVAPAGTNFISAPCAIGSRGANVIISSWDQGVAGIRMPGWKGQRSAPPIEIFANVLLYNWLIPLCAEI